MEIRQVPYTDYDLQTLVQELDDFFLKRPGDNKWLDVIKVCISFSLMTYECVCYEKEPIGVAVNLY